MSIVKSCTNTNCCYCKAEDNTCSMDEIELDEDGMCTTFVAY